MRPQDHVRPRGLLERLLHELQGDFHIHTSSSSQAAANRRHGPTISGSRSDHQGPGHYAWALDVPAITGLEGDRIASDVAHYLRLDWPGSGLHTEVKRFGGRRYQLQLIWRAPGHFGHIHVGAHRLDVPVPLIRWP